jgi:hypothetical protein
VTELVVELVQYNAQICSASVRLEAVESKGCGLEVLYHFIQLVCHASRRPKYTKIFVHVTGHQRDLRMSKQVANGREMAHKIDFSRAHGGYSSKRHGALTECWMCGTRIILRPLIAVGAAGLQKKRCNIGFRCYSSIVICVAYLFLKLMILQLPEKCPAIFDAHTNFF